MKCSLGISNFLEEFSSLSHSIVFLFLCTDHWGRLSYLFLLFFWTLHSDGCIFAFLLCFLLLFFSQLFVRPPQTAILPFCISFPGGWSWSLSPVQCHKPHSIVHQGLYQIRPLNLFLTSTGFELVSSKFCSHTSFPQCRLIQQQYSVNTHYASGTMLKQIGQKYELFIPHKKPVDIVDTIREDKKIMLS